MDTFFRQNIPAKRKRVNCLPAPKNFQKELRSELMKLRDWETLSIVCMTKD